MRRIGISCLACLFMHVSPAVAQETVGDDIAPSPRIAAVRLTGDKLPTLATDALREQLRVRGDRRFLGIPGITPARWLYLLAEDKEGGLARALRQAGEAPLTYTPALVEADATRLEDLFRQEGFLDARVMTRLDTIAEPASGSLALRVTFDVEAGLPTVVQRVRYSGLEALTPEERRALAAHTTLRLQPVGEPENLDFLAEDQRLSERELLGERQAVLEFLRGRGFARATRDSVRAVVFGMPEQVSDRTEIDTVTVVMEVRPGPRYRFGDVLISAVGPESGVVSRIDTFQVGDGRVRVEIDGDRSLSPDLFRRALRIEPGQRYNIKAIRETKRRLEQTGVFEFTEVVPLALDTAQHTDRIAHRIRLRLRKRHTIRLEGFVLQRTLLLGTESEELALGAGATYTARNLLGGGEALAVRTAGSVAGDVAQGFPDVQGEASVALTLPSLIRPFGALERALNPYSAQTRLSLGVLSARREALGILVRGRASLGVRLGVQHSPSLTSGLDVLDFTLSDPDTLDGFGERFLAFVDDPIARQVLLEDYTQPQVGNALRYTLRANTADPFRRDRGLAAELSAEVGGHLPELLDRYVFTPGETEGSLPGLPLFGGDTSNRLEYRPYARALADVRRYVPRGRAVFAFKTVVGAAHPTGRAPVVPFDRRFYAGGASGVRGWRLRTLGPGAVETDGAYVQGGDIKLEAAAEARFAVIPRLWNAEWQLAAFADAGNVWFGPAQSRRFGRAISC